MSLGSKVGAGPRRIDEFEKPGLYEVSFGFFAEKDADVQLLVNGDVAIESSAQQQQQQAFSRRGNHPAGNVTGWTHHNFIALPADATVQIRFRLAGRSLETDEPQGFFFLRKL